MASEQKIRKGTKERQSRVLIYSDDPDLAKSLKMLLEDTFDVVCETSLHQLSGAIDAASPSLLLIDLNSIPSDIRNTMAIVAKRNRTVPVVTLGIYQQAKPELQKMIETGSTLVIYKPVDVAEVCDRIVDLLSPRKQPA